MATESGGVRQCAECERTYPTHRWGQIRAHDDGWFTKRDGTAWCPDHLPDWVANWRNKTATEAGRP